MVFEPDISIIRRKQTCRFQCNSLICQKDTIFKRFVRWHCQGQRSCRAKNRNTRVKAFSYDFPKLHHSNHNSFGANVHLRPILKRVKVIERSRGVTPMSKYDRSKGHGQPMAPCASNLVQFRLTRFVLRVRLVGNFWID